MMKPFDRNMFTQIGLDSGSLTILGAVIHSFGEPGEYRGSAAREGDQAVFFITVDKNSPVAQANIDLATLAKPEQPSKECCESEEARNRFSVNPKGYAVFHVSEGSGGYHVNVRRAEENPEEKVFDSRTLSEGDIFSAVLLRPGTYSVANAHTGAKAEVVVSYPEVGRTPYRPPGPVRVQATREGFEPRYVQLSPGQPLLFDCRAEARIQIELQKPDDGPGTAPQAGRRGWRKYTLPEQSD